MIVSTSRPVRRDTGLVSTAWLVDVVLNSEERGMSRAVSIMGGRSTARIAVVEGIAAVVMGPWPGEERICSRFLVVFWCVFVR